MSALWTTTERNDSQTVYNGAYSQGAPLHTAITQIDSVGLEFELIYYCDLLYFYMRFKLYFLTKTREREMKKPNKSNFE